MTKKVIRIFERYNVQFWGKILKKSLRNFSPVKRGVKEHEGGAMCQICKGRRS